MSTKIKFLISLFIFFVCLTPLIAGAAALYYPGQTLQPACAPGTLNCTVTPPAASGANSDITALNGLTVNDLNGTLSFIKGGTGLTTIGAGELLYALSANSLAPLSLNADLVINSGALAVDDSNLSLVASRHLKII